MLKREASPPPPKIIHSDVNMEEESINTHHPSSKIINEQVCQIGIDSLKIEDHGDERVPSQLSNDSITDQRSSSATNQSQPPSSSKISASSTSKLKSILPSLTSCIYTAYYCEENIWHLCDKIRKEYGSELGYCEVVFISNPTRTVPLWRQKMGRNDDKLAIWDYHVILLYKPDERCVVYDMDSELPFPTHFPKYITETFRGDRNILKPEFRRFFRVISASTFLDLFCSDRSHMKKEDGSFTYPPPDYPPIQQEIGLKNNFHEFLDMSKLREKTAFGEVFCWTDFVRRYFQKPSNS